MKKTKRKGFNFLRSYFDVLNQLETDSDKLNFLLSIINKQFLDINPEGLNFVVKLAYESQRHQVESSVKGYKDKMKTELDGSPMIPPSVGGRQGGIKAPSVQEEEKGEGQEQDVSRLESLRIEFQKLYPKATNPINLLNSLQQLPKIEQEKAVRYISKYVRNTEPKFIMKPENYLKSYCWNDKQNEEPKKKLNYFN